MLQGLRETALAVNETLASAADNAFDWLFRRESLVKSGLTPFEVVYASDLMRVRYYPPPVDEGLVLPDGQRLPVSGRRHAVPLVLVPPLGVSTETFDLMPQRSLVRHMAARGFATYLIDWGRPERRHAHLNLKDYAGDMFGAALAAVRAHSGQRELSLMGWCMGGLLSLLHLGLSGDREVRNLITVASPVDLRGGGLVARAAATLDAPARLIRRFSRWRLHQVDPAALHVPGWLTTLAFKLTAPVSAVTAYWDLLTRLSDREFVESHSTTADYLDNMLLYPGGVVQDFVVKLAVDNQLASGRIELRGEVADLARIRSNLLVFAGETDHLVAPAIARRLLDLVPVRDKTFRLAPGGHMGVILGEQAPAAVWEPCVQWLAERSRAPAPAPRPAPRLRRRRKAAAL